MAGEMRLARNIRDLMGKAQMSIYQGIITGVDGVTCSIRFGSQEVSGIRLRASLSDNDRQILVVPKVDTAVVVGSLSGDLADLVVLKADEIERIEVNGGQLGGLINIDDLTDKLNKLVNEVNALKNAFNGHTHTGTISGSCPTGDVSGSCSCSAPLEKAQNASKFNKDDYEDTTVTH